MSSIPIEAGQRVTGAVFAASDSARKHRRLLLVGTVMRAVFILSLFIVMAHVSMPQSTTLWNAYDAPGDLMRLVLGFVACTFIAVQLLAVPKDPQAYRTWLYLGAAAVPFALICIFFIW